MVLLVKRVAGRCWPSLLQAWTGFGGVSGSRFVVKRTSPRRVVRSCGRPMKPQFVRATVHFTSSTSEPSKCSSPGVSAIHLSPFIALQSYGRHFDFAAILNVL